MAAEWHSSIAVSSVALTNVSKKDQMQVVVVSGTEYIHTHWHPDRRYL
jgi:hypothetical protein